MSEAVATTPDAPAAAPAAPETPVAPAAPVEPAAAPAPEPQVKSFHEMLPEGIRGHEIFKDLEDPSQLTERLQGYIPKPSPPKTADEYYGGEEAGKKLGALQPIIHRIAETAHATGMPKEQFAAIAKGMADQHAEFMKNQQKLHQEGLDTLSKDWGENLEKNLGMANSVLDTFDPDGEVDRIIETAGLSNHPAVIRFFHKIANSLEDDTIIRGEGGKGKGTFSLNQMYPNHTE